MHPRDLQYTLNKQRSLHYNDPLSNTSMYSNEEGPITLLTDNENDGRLFGFIPDEALEAIVCLIWSLI